MKNKKKVINGVAGFIGSNILYGTYKDNKIILIDDTSTQKLENIIKLLEEESIKLVKGFYSLKNGLEKTTIYSKGFHETD